MAVNNRGLRRKRKNLFSCCTYRELQAYYWLLRGRSLKETANELFISEKTVGSHLLKLRKKLGCAHRYELFDRAWEFGLIDIESKAFKKIFCLEKSF